MNLLCPRCAAPVTVLHFGRSGKFAGHHEAHRYGVPCAWRMGTWGYYKTEAELAVAVQTLEPRRASAENLERVAAVVHSRIGEHARTARLKKEVLALMRRVEELEAAA